ncbi:MAG TPA: SDR family oxidoreductase [Gammaproteobacteria bacterium]|nr:SDR family oxidoreductase [Gammaproteobacteria bacterium]
MSTEKVAIITGSSSGIGAAVALKLAATGIRIVINYKNNESGAKEVLEKAKTMGSEAILVQADISDDMDCRKMVEQTIQKWQRVDYLVNNAGVSKFVKHADLEELNSHDFHQIYAVNVVGAYQMIRAVVPHMRKLGRGSIVNISSVAGTLAIGSSIAYAASKAALNNMTQSLARALAPEIQINAICPGFVSTRWFKNALGEEGYNKKITEIETKMPLKVASNAEDIAETVVYFLVANHHVTGELLQVDAGMHLLVAN